MAPAPRPAAGPVGGGPAPRAVGPQAVGEGGKEKTALAALAEAPEHVRAALEAEAGVDLAALRRDDPGLVAFLRRAARAEGTRLFKAGRYREAAVKYSEAVAAAGEAEPELFANRAQCYLALGRPEDAAIDAARAVELRPDWAKGLYRLGSALAALDRPAEAAAALRRGLEAAPQSAELRAALAEAEAAAAEHERAAARQTKTARRDLVLKLREARRHDARLAMTNQFKQSMAAPDWAMDDYEWRPTFFPQLRFRQTDAARKLREAPDGVARALHGYCQRLGELEAPRQAVLPMLDVANCEAWYGAYEAALTRALADQPGAHLVVLDRGTGVLALLAARLGAGAVTCLVPNRMLYRMCCQTVAANPDLAEKVEVVEARLEACHVAGEAAVPAAAARAAAAADSAAGATQRALAERGDVLVVEWFGHDLLGLGALGAIDHAARWLLYPGAPVIPAAATVRGQLLDLRVGEVSGFDLSSLNAYRWHPRSERVDLAYELSQAGHRAVSAPFDVLTIDFQRRADALSAGPPGAEADAPRPLWDVETGLAVPATADGPWNAVGTWYDLTLAEGVALSSAAGAHPGQSVQYLEEGRATPGEPVALKVWQDAGQLLLTADPPRARPKHAQVPRWHFDMVLDDERNGAYEAAVRNAVDLKRAFGAQEVLALDVGAGSGLLSMLAARAGADRVVACEINGHMCDVGEETVVMNGFADRILMLNRDARRMSAAVRKPDGTPPDLDRKADVLIYEVFDSGLIGEGALHLVAHAREKLLREDATLVPMSASVFCQPLQFRVGAVRGLDAAQVNRWRWRPDYEGVDLNGCRGAWTPLAEPTEVFLFDFYEHEANMVPAQRAMRIPIHTDGVLNAVAFWFELHLDEETTLSTSPHGAKGRTWQQAVQLVEEVRVTAGMELGLVGRHDTYGISFETDDASLDRVSRRTGVPLWDPTWKFVYDQVNKVHGEIARSAVNNPLAYRRMAEAGVWFATRPTDFGLNPDTAVDFCLRTL